ncbi:YhcN/YlaJ family sporulation lipoprotein [Paenibacillus sp. CC-CFT747]|nr:YhcN/YlaJ family sporulation lipoprotein [Paenibacillus sp. CC-CFT747]
MRRSNSRKPGAAWASPQAWSSFAALAALAVTVTACSGAGPNQTKTNSYSRDGMLGATQANPNMIHSQTYHHYKDDKALMQSTLSKIKGVVDATILTNGPDAYVTLKVPPGMKTAEADQVLANAQKALSENMPRYRMHVKLAKRSSR